MVNIGLENIRKPGLALLVGVVLMIGGTTASAQSRFEVTIQQFNSDEVRGYVQPLGDMFGANMNAGLSHSADVGKDGFHFRIDIVGMISVVSDEHRSYTATLPSGFIPQGGSYQTATVFGGAGTTFKDANSGLEYRGSDGVFSTSLFPLFVPQVTIGTLFGTQAMVRYIYIPSLSGGKLPSSRLWGVGMRHSISQYFGATPPFDAAVAFFYSDFSLGNIVELQGTVVDLQISKSVLLFTFYGGIAVQQSSMELRYNHQATSASNSNLVDVALSGGNTFRVTTGLQIDLQAVRLFADANFGRIQHFSGGIGFGL